MPWPMTSHDFENSIESYLPEKFLRFLYTVITRQKDIHPEKEKVYRLLLSFAQDICRAVTGREWKFPKHILLCTTLRHLYRCMLLICILNRLGHSENYNFALELEFALEKAVIESSVL